MAINQADKTTTFTEKVCTAIISTVEYLAPSVMKSVQFEPRDFGEILPAWYMGTTPSHPTEAVKSSATSLETKSAIHEELRQGPQHVASKAA
uniref:Uncharacterized protein n=1 Tax=Globisporangium ultimum (strain ATCC 200006 / CBS 805.95 / DAOM BR144) TaxID=431595 RepID=K3WD29_GLOUD